MERFDITYFEGPGADYIIREEVVADIAASGMTLCQLWFTYDVETNIRALQLLEKYHMKATVYEKRITELYHEGDADKIDAVVKTVTGDYKDYFHVISGWEIADEPNTDNFALLYRFREAFKKYVPQHEVVINLFPNYASNEMLKAKDYEDYVSRYIREVKPDLLSYDYYPFTGRKVQQELLDVDDTDDERERSIRTAAMVKDDRQGFFENLEIVRRLGNQNGLDQVLIVQLTEHGVYRNLMYEELLWQINMCLAYGMRRLAYFTYWQPLPDDFWTWDQSMCDRKGNKYQHYYDAQRINRQAYPIGQILFEHRSEAIFHLHTGEKGTKEFAGYGIIDEIRGERGVIGFFDDDYVYLVNHDYIHSHSYEIKSNAGMERYTGEGYVTCKSIFDITLDPGAGVLLRRCKEA